MPEAVKEVEPKKVDKAAEEPGESTEAAPRAKAGSGALKKIVIMAAGLQLLAAVGAFAFVKFFVAPKIQQASETPKTEQPAVKEKGEIHLIENILVNPAGTNGTRFLSTSIGVETAKIGGGGEGGEGDGFKKISPIIRDVLIAILSSKTMEELSSIDGKARLRDEILAKVNQAVAPDSIYNVYFVDYVLQ